MTHTQLQALQRASAYRVPLYVTEMGVSIASPAHRCYAADASMKEVREAPEGGLRPAEGWRPEVLRPAEG
jgi:hypothetical protein